MDCDASLPILARAVCGGTEHVNNFTGQRNGAAGSLKRGCRFVMRVKVWLP